MPTNGSSPVSSPSNTGEQASDLLFLPNDAGEVEGLNDAGIQTYREYPYASIARECGQNSNDAAVKRPVLVSYNLITLDDTEIPGVAKLRLAVDACLAAAVKSGDEKATDFFEQAK